MDNYITQLTEGEILSLGKVLTGKSSTRIKKYEFDNGKLFVEYRVDRNAPKGTSVLERTKIYSVSAEIEDYGFEGLINSYYPLNIERYFERFVGFMIKKFGKEYAQNLYNHHKEIVDEIADVSAFMMSKLDKIKQNPKVSSVLHTKAINLKADHSIELKRLRNLINENLLEDEKINRI